MTAALRLSDLLDDRLHAHSVRVRADYAAHLADLGAPGPSATKEDAKVSLYHVLPWLFEDAIPGLSDEQLHDLAVAGLLYCGHVLLVDRTVDQDDRFSAPLLLTANAMHERSLVLLAQSRLLTRESAAVLRDYTRAYERALMRERSVVSGESFAWPDYCDLASSKAAILKASPGMMVAAARSPVGLPVVDEMLDAFSLAAQLEDDIDDWRSDVEHGRTSFIVGLARLDGMSIEDARAFATEPETSIAHWLYFEGNAERALAEGADASRRSSRAAERIGAARWAKAARYYGERIERIQDRFATERRRILAHDERSGSRETVAHTARAALAWVEAQIDGAFDVHAHRMRFRGAYGFHGTEDQTGSVFQRSVAGWAQNVCAASGLAVTCGSVDRNLDALLAMRRAEEPGGWSYFPDLADLPPDADDLGQVCLAWSRARRAELAPIVGPARELLLHEHVHENGALGTWLTDPRAPGEQVARYEWAIRTHWGRAMDPEVTANVAYGLMSAGFALPTDVVIRATDWVERCQSADGAWESTWYTGPYYGAFVCSRLIRTISGGSPALARAERFLLERQRGDGGWGSAASDSLSTALAALALLEIRTPAALEAARRGVAYLGFTQGAGGDWSSVPFIKMDVNRAVPGSTPRLLHHGSALLTTCFALAATVGVLGRSGS